VPEEDPSTKVPVRVLGSCWVLFVVAASVCGRAAENRRRSRSSCRSCRGGEIGRVFISLCCGTHALQFLGYV
jgi:hypothetical protein